MGHHGSSCTGNGAPFTGNIIPCCPPLTQGNDQHQNIPATKHTRANMTRKEVMFVLLMIASSLLSIVCSRGNSVRDFFDDDLPPDFFVLSRNNIPAFCYLTSMDAYRKNVSYAIVGPLNTKEESPCATTSNVSDWSIHGLWANRFNGTDHNSCRNATKFDKELIRSIYPKMLINWPSVFNNNEMFWKHEWEKHGSCSKAVPALNSQLKYFKSSIDLNEKFNISAAFERAQLQPSMKLLKKDAVQQIINKEVGGGKQVYITCATDRKKETYLTEIRLCLGTDFEPIDCPPKFMLKKRKPSHANAGHQQPCPQQFYYMPRSALVSSVARSSEFLLIAILTCGLYILY